jgi:hypothetical protein
MAHDAQIDASGWRDPILCHTAIYIMEMAPERGRIARDGLQREVYQYNPCVSIYTRLITRKHLNVHNISHAMRGCYFCNAYHW